MDGLFVGHPARVFNAQEFEFDRSETARSPARAAGQRFCSRSKEAAGSARQGVSISIRSAAALRAAGSRIR
jgi:hypothetical protein